MTPAIGRPSLDAQITALAKRLLAGPIKLEDTTDVEDRVLARMEQLDLVDLGATTARLTEKGRALAGSGSVAAAATNTPRRRGLSCVIEADPSAIEWGDPPEKKVGGGRTSWFAPFEPILMAKPGKWARVLTCDVPKRSSNVASSLRVTFARHKLQFEAIGRGGAVYARFVGKGK